MIGRYLILFLLAGCLTSAPPKTIQSSVSEPYRSTPIFNNTPIPDDNSDGETPPNPNPPIYNPIPPNTPPEQSTHLLSYSEGTYHNGFTDQVAMSESINIAIINENLRSAEVRIKINNCSTNLPINVRALEYDEFGINIRSLNLGSTSCIIAKDGYTFLPDTRFINNYNQNYWRFDFYQQSNRSDLASSDRFRFIHDLKVTKINTAITATEVYRYGYLNALTAQPDPLSYEGTIHLKTTRLTQAINTNDIGVFVKGTFKLNETTLIQENAEGIEFSYSSSVPNHPHDQLVRITISKLGTIIFDEKYHHITDIMRVSYMHGPSDGHDRLWAALFVDLTNFDVTYCTPPDSACLTDYWTVGANHSGIGPLIHTARFGSPFFQFYKATSSGLFDHLPTITVKSKPETYDYDMEFTINP